MNKQLCVTKIFVFSFLCVSSSFGNIPNGFSWWDSLPVSMMSLIPSWSVTKRVIQEEAGPIVASITNHPAAPYVAGGCFVWLISRFQNGKKYPKKKVKPLQEYYIHRDHFSSDEEVTEIRAHKVFNREMDYKAAKKEACVELFDTYKIDLKDFHRVKILPIDDERIKVLLSDFGLNRIKKIKNLMIFDFFVNHCTFYKKNIYNKPFPKENNFRCPGMI